MASSVGHFVRGALCGAVLIGAACGSKKADAPAVDPLLGAWCQQSEAAAANGPRKLVGAKWELRSDGTYSYAYKWHRWDERWSRAGSALDLGKLGSHTIVRIEQGALELSQGNVHKYFGRDCGPEYAQAELVHQLVEAAGSSARAKVEDTLGRGANIDGIDTLGVREQTALIAAVRAHDVPMVQLLLARGARHDIATSEGITAMNAAELAGYQDIVELLLKAGAQPSARMAPPRPPTAEEIEAARVNALLNLDPGALINKDAPSAKRAPEPAAALPTPSAPSAPAPLSGAAPVAEQPAAPPKPDPKQAEQEKELEELKRTICQQRPASSTAVSPEMAEMLKEAGMAPGVHEAQQQAIYDQICK